ncbi:MAG: M50 family metallopeptidase [Candidatus Dadabacteria bacterium]|nr:M50 family metallopeptidase [Candidatus Dadabacteria bacterium]
MFTAFDLISIFYCVIAIGVIRRLIKNWKPFWDDHVTPFDKRLVTEISFFILIPIGVLLHELGHALATWQVGGTVIEFEWRIFWGYIIPQGDFTTVQRWWISFSGNLVSILIGIIPLFFISRVRKIIVKELLLNFARIELVYSLIVYPLFSFVGFRGDWVRIYDFSVKPYAQITLALHILLLLILWKKGVFKGEEKPRQPNSW